MLNFVNGKKPLQLSRWRPSRLLETSRVGRSGRQIVEGFRKGLFPAQWKEHVDE